MTDASCFYAVRLCVLCDVTMTKYGVLLRQTSSSGNHNQAHWDIIGPTLSLRLGLFIYLFIYLTGTVLINQHIRFHMCVNGPDQVSRSKFNLICSPCPPWAGS